MKSTVYTVLTLMLFVGTACHRLPMVETNSPSTPDEYVVFGSYYGECMGDACVQIFKIENGELYADTRHRYPSRSTLYDANFSLLEQSKYEKVKGLVHAIPAGLQQEQGRVIGMPDAYDQGGIYVEIKVKGERQFWCIDNDAKNIPAYLHDMLKEVQQAIQLVR